MKAEASNPNEIAEKPEQEAEETQKAKLEEQEVLAKAPQETPVLPTADDKPLPLAPVGLVRTTVPPPYGAAPVKAYTPPVKIKAPFSATKSDAIFALLFIFISYMVVRWGGAWEGYRVTIFSALYAGTVLGFAVAKKAKPSIESWFWLAIYLVAGISFSFWTVESMRILRFVLMLGTGLYWVASLFSGLLLKKTSNYFILDVLNLLFIVPFKNLICLPKSFSGFRGKDSEEKQNIRKQRNYVLLGLLISLPLLLFIVPNLLAADSMGGFANFFDNIYENFDLMVRVVFPGGIVGLVVDMLLTIPVAFYLVSLIYGYVHKRNAQNFDERGVKKRLNSLRFLPKATVVTVLCMVAGLYAIYVATQIPYFFSAFRGELASGYILHSSYARDGFFQLCGLVVLNLGILLLANMGCKQMRVESRILKAFNVFLSLLTMVLIFTAFSKMMLYMNTSGLTILRVLVCSFLVFLLFVWVGVIALQFVHFSIARASLLVGTAMLCALCVMNIDTVISNYDVQFYANAKARTAFSDYHTIPDISGIMLSNWTGASDVEAVYKYYSLLPVYQDADRREIAHKLAEILWQAGENKGNTTDTLAWANVRNNMASKLLEIDDVREHYEKISHTRQKPEQIEKPQKAFLLHRGKWTVPTIGKSGYRHR